MAAEKSLAWNVEELVMHMLSGSPGLAGIPRRHHDEKQPSRAETIVVQAVIGESLDAAMQPNNVEVRVTFATSKFPAPMANQVATFIHDGIHHPTIPPPAQTELSFLSIEQEGSSILADDGKKVRKRVVVVPMIAKLKT